MRFIPASAGTYVPASHEDKNDPGVFKNVLATHETLIDGKVQMINWAKLPVGSAFQAHFHEDMQETFIIVTGDASMTVDGTVCQVSKRDTVIIEPREVHTMKNTGAIEVEYIVIGISTGQGGKTVVVA